jgi:D-alanyl-D-alanine carboxypeptidase (penicillin-binding protein 5/6)
MDMTRLLTVQLFFVFLLLFAGGHALNNAYAEEVGARAAVVIDDATEKILYAKNPNWKLPPASTTKLVTAMVAIDNISPDKVITVSRTAADTPSVTPHLRAGERFKVRDILYLALMRSVNSAAVVLAEATAGSEERFAALMNEKVSSLGAENTHFINASGLPGPGQHITAFDLAKVMKASLQYPLIKEIINTRTKDIYSTEGRRIFVKSTDQLLWLDDDLLGGKTGYTRAARHCFVCAAQKGGATLISAVLGESVRDDLWHDSQILLNRGYDVITQKAEPMIYFSSAGESPVVLAAYKSGVSNKGHKIARHRQRNRTRTARQNHKKRRGGQVKIAKKGKRLSVRNLS